MDLQKVVDLVMMGSTTPGTTIIPPNYYQDPDWHWEPPADVKYTYDPEKAKQRSTRPATRTRDGDGVREYKGEPIELRLIARSESTEEQQMAKLIAGWFQDVGIKVKLEVMDSSTLSDTILNYEGDVLTPDYDMFLWGWYLDYDPGSMLSYFTKAQIGNWSDSYWTDPEYEQLYKQQSEELDPAKRKEIHRPDAADPLRAVAVHRHRLPARLRGLQHGQVGGLHRDPDPNGNTLVPPFGNGGYANFLTIEPKTAGGSGRRAAASSATRGSSSSSWSWSSPSSLVARAPRAAREGDGGVTPAKAAGA